jgi:hypothetical protein
LLAANFLPTRAVPLIVGLIVAVALFMTVKLWTTDVAAR